MAPVVFLLVTLPWLNPFSPGPVAQAMPLLFAWACAGALLLVLAVDHQHGRSASTTRAVVLAWATAAALSAGIGLLQYLGTSSALGDWVNHPETGQAYGNLRQRNQFATLLGIGLAALFWLAAQANAWLPSQIRPGREALSERQPPNQPHAPAIAAGNPPATSSPSYAALLAMAALLGAGNAASGSRTGLLQLVLLALLALFWWRGRTTAQQRPVQGLLAAALLGYTLATLALPLLIGLDPLGSSAWARLRAGDAACASRLTLWANVLHLIGQKPWLGWGWGELDYAHFITLYPGPRFCDILDNAHNLPLQLAVELGLPAALLLCGAALWLIWRGQPWRETQPTRQLAWAVLALIGLHSLLEYPLWYGPFQTAAALCGWLLYWQPGGRDGSQNYKHFWPAASYLSASIAILLIAYCGFAAWQYRIASQIYLPPELRASAYRVDTLAKSRNVWLYQDTVRFAELTTTDLDADNAAQVHALAKEMLHFSPETRVIRLLLDSARLLGRDDEVAFYGPRFKAAFPKDYAAWAPGQP